VWLEHLRIAAGVLRAHKVRSLLTVVSITIGAFSIVLMTSLADSGLKTLFVGIEELGGSRLLSVWRKSPDAMEARQLSYTRGLTRQDAEALRGIPHLRDVTQLVTLRNKVLHADTGAQVAGDIVAGDGRFFSFFRYRAAQGRLFDAHDIASHARVCVVGDVLADKIFGPGEQVIGRSISVLGARCRIIGRLAKVDRWGIRFGWPWDEVLAIPLETLSDFMRADLDRGRQLFLQTDSPRHNDVVKRIMNARLMERHHDVDDFAIFDLEKRLQGFFQIFLIMKVVVALIAAITMLVGGVGIMNIMLVSVAERVREIGIRKALGASPRDIGRQFLVEAVLLSLAGGLIGVASGMGAAIGGSRIIAHFKPSWVTSISEPAVLASVTVALLVGGLFGYFPARRAGRMDPVEAIRN
jgi:putative ABC transport system permease protein